MARFKLMEWFKHMKWQKQRKLFDQVARGWSPSVQFLTPTIAPSAHWFRSSWTISSWLSHDRELIICWTVGSIANHYFFTFNSYHDSFRSHFHLLQVPIWPNESKTSIWAFLVPLQIGVYREKFYIGIFVKFFWGTFYTCGQARKNFWTKGQC